MQTQSGDTINRRMSSGKGADGRQSQAAQAQQSSVSGCGGAVMQSMRKKLLVP